MWWWILVWSLLVLAAVATFGLLGWRLIRQVMALGREFARNAERMAQAYSEPSQPYLPATSVLADPSVGAVSAGSVSGLGAARPAADAYPGVLPPLEDVLDAQSC